MASRKLEIELVADNHGLSRAFRGSIRDSETLGSKLRHVGAVGAAALGGALVTGATAATYGIVKTTQAAEESNKVHKQSRAVLQSTGAEAWITAGKVETLAGAISRKAGIDDEAIQSGENILLTFKEIQNQAGKGNDIFNQATRVTTDLSVALGKDLNSSAIMVGKALNDPIKGATALGRAGVQLTEQQKEQIETFTESGDVLSAQKIILRELESQFGGSARAQATALDKIKVSLGNVEESVGNVFLPLINQAAGDLDRELVPKLQRTADSLAEISAQKNIDLSEKLRLGGDVIKRDWGDVPGQIGELIDEAAPVVAEHAGQLGVVWAKGMLNGFLAADPLGKAAVLLFASKAFGGPGAVIGAGKQVGSKFGGAMATESAVALSAMGLSSRGTKVFGLIDRARSLGKTVGIAGLGLGLLEGAEAAFSDPADGLAARLEELDERGSGLIGTLERVGPAGGLAGLASSVGIDSWASQGDEAHRLAEILTEVNSLHGKQHQLLVAEARALEDQLGLTSEQRQEVEKTLRAQTIAGQNLQQGMHGLKGGQFTRLPDIQAVVAANSQAISTKFEEGSQGARNATARNFNAAVKAIEVGMDRGVIKTKVGMAEIKRLTRQAHLVSGDDPWGIAKGFQRSWAKAGTATKQNLNNIERDLGRMPPAAAQVTGQMMIQMARQMRQKGQLSKAEMEKIRSTVVTKLALMAQQGGKKGDAFAANLGGSFGTLSVDVAEALENIGVNVGEILQKLGAKNPLMGFTLSYIRSHGGGGKGGGYLDQVPELGQARGGMRVVGGSGLYDSVPVKVNGGLSAVVAPGETLATFTQHQRPMVEEALSYRWGVAGLQDFFDTYDRPHWMARGGLHEPRVHGPDPLRAGAQAGIHKAYKAGKAYIRKHRPHPTGSSAGVAGYSGPPANMKQLGDNAWVDSHTLAVAAYLASKFGLTESSGYRSPAHNAAVGGVPGSLHTHGSSGNPGAIDFVPPSNAALSFATSHIAGLEEALIHDAGSGLHLHLGFFDKGGVVTGKATWFNGGATAGGSSTSQPGLALNLNTSDEPGGWNNETTQGWMEASKDGHPVFARVSVGGKSANLPITDLGPASWTGNSIDVTEGGVRKLGFTTENFPSGTVGKAVILGAGGEKSPPASKEQKHTLGSLRHRAQGVLKEARELEEKYKQYGGTERGKRALDRALKFAKEAARKIKAGNRDEAKDLIDKARDSIGRSRDSIEQAAEGVFTPGLKPGKVPGVATTTYDPSQPYSPTNLPGYEALPPEVKKILKSPGLDWSGKYGALETALSMSGMTDTKADDAAALNAMLGMDRQKRKRLKAKLAELNRRLSKGGLTQKQRDNLEKRRDQVLSELGEVTSNISGIREQIGGLNEEGEGEGDKNTEALEALTQAIEGQKEAQADLAAEMKANREMSESIMGTSAAVAWRALADLTSGQLGARTLHKGALAGNGSIGTVGNI